MKKIKLFTTLCLLGFFIFNAEMAFGQIAKAVNTPKFPFPDITNGGQILDVEEEGKIPSPNNNGKDIKLHPDRNCKVRLSFHVFAANIEDNWPSGEPMTLRFKALGFTEYYSINSAGFNDIQPIASDPMHLNVTTIEFDMSVLCEHPGMVNGRFELELALVKTRNVNQLYPIADHSADGEIFACQNFAGCVPGGDNPDLINISRRIFVSCGVTDCEVNNAAENPKDRSQEVQNELHSSFELSLAPNPAADYTQLNYSLDLASEVNYICFDATGKKISEAKDWQNAGFHQKRVDTESWAPGLYWIQLKVGDQVETKRLVKY